MGGAKKKSIGNQEKTTKDTPAADDKTKKGEKKGPFKQKQKTLIANRRSARIEDHKKHETNYVPIIS